MKLQTLWPGYAVATALDSETPRTLFPSRMSLLVDRVSVLDARRAV